MGPWLQESSSSSALHAALPGRVLPSSPDRPRVHSREPPSHPPPGSGRPPLGPSPRTFMDMPGHWPPWARCGADPMCPEPLGQMRVWDAPWRAKLL